jgi:hypothetical protein
MKKKAAKTGKAKTSRKRSATKDLSAKKAGSVKGGLLPAVHTAPTASSYKILSGDGSVRPGDVSVKLIK